MKYFLGKLAIGFLTLVLVATLCFFLTKAAGEDAVFGEGRVSQTLKDQLRSEWRLDRPIYEQYFLHMGKLLVLDSMPSRKLKGWTLRDVLRYYLPNSLRLGVRAMILAILLGVPIGAMCAVYHTRIVDNAGSIMALGGVSVPSFVLASLAIFYLSRKWGIFPATDWHLSQVPFEMSESFNPFLRGVVEEIFRLRLWIPAACLAAFPFAAILRLTRSTMLDALRQDYVRTARAKGLSPRRVIARHALRNALTPVVTYIGPVTAGVLTGSLVVEKIFAIPGLGKSFIDNVNNRDTPIIMGLTVFFSALLIGMNLLVDAVYPILNPRLRKS